MDCVHLCSIIAPQTKMPLEIGNGTFTRIINI